MELIHRDGMYVLELGASENRMNPGWLDGLLAKLDEVEADPGAPLLLHGGGKFFSNGLDIDWLVAHPEDRAGFLTRVHALLARLLVFPAFTVAAIQGHAFAAGAMLALACDARVMRSDRGFMCLPEVDLNLVFTPGMAALIQSKTVPSVAHEAMVTGRRYTAPEALAAGLVDEVVPEEAVVERALARARAVGPKTPTTLSGIKGVMYAGALARLAGPNEVALPDVL